MCSKGWWGIGQTTSLSVDGRSGLVQDGPWWPELLWKSMSSGWNETRMGSVVWLVTSDSPKFSATPLKTLGQLIGSQCRKVAKFDIHFCDVKNLDTCRLEKVWVNCRLKCMVCYVCVHGVQGYTPLFDLFPKLSKKSEAKSAAPPGCAPVCCFISQNRPCFDGAFLGVWICMRLFF